MSFVHLHVHSEYSLLKSSAITPQLVDKCIKDNMPALALTDYGNMFGSLDFYFKCKEKGIKPIIGCELYITKDRLEKKIKTSHLKSETLVLLIQNEEGYRNLCHLSTIGYQEGFYYIPQIDKKILKKYNKGLIALTGGLLGTLLKKYENNSIDVALKEISDLKEIFGDRLYLEYTQTNPKKYNQFLIESSHLKKIPLVATNDVHYLRKEDSIYQDVLLCIGNNRTLEDDEREQLPHKEFYLKSPQEMKILFKDYPEAIEKTLEIEQRCNLEFKTKDNKGRPIYHLPNPDLEKKKNPQSELNFLSKKGLDSHIIQENLSEKTIHLYKERLNKELTIIQSMGFTGYFLIVHEFVHWAKEKSIPVGPGRGSGASSLVAFCLGITDLDPMPHDLLFERFLNPERISIPDFDVDFCQENRNKVIQHVQNKYGSDYVAQVITFGRMQTRAAIRDVGRVMAMPYSQVDSIAKLIPDQLGITINEALEKNETLKELTTTDSQISTLIELAKGIEGLVRHVSIHAAGVIISDQPILHYAPLYRGAENENVIQYDLKNAKKIGLVKFDFLGLKTLTQITEALKLIKQNRKKDILLKDISTEDSGIYKIITAGDTLGIFQFEGYGITDLIKKAKPTCFKDIIAINALFRPGPMDMIPDYLSRRKLKTSKYIFPELEPILKETHGIIVYQEQVMLISSLIAGYSFAEADVLRRAMGEKILSEMKKQKNRFLSGATKQGYDLKKSEELFNLVVEFAKYGFNKAHAAAYCVLTAQTAWLKCYYPVEFYSSLMTTEMANSSKITRCIKNLKKQQIQVSSPDINKSEYAFSVNGNEVYFALGAIKGVGRSAVDEIIITRNKQKSKKFTSFDHFLDSMDSRKINKKTIDSLIKAGAFDNLGYPRVQMILNYEALMERSEKRKQDKVLGQKDLFSLSSENLSLPLTVKKKWTKLDELNFEKESIGFYLSQHPLDYFKHLTHLFHTESISQLKNKKSKNIQVWGMIDEIKEIKTRKNETMALVTLEDESDYLDLIIFSKIYLDIEKMLVTNEPLLVKGRINYSKDSSRCIVEKVIPLNYILSQVKKIEIKISNNMEKQLLEKLKDTLTEHKGKTNIIFKVKTDNNWLSFKSHDPAGINLNISVLEKMNAIIPKTDIFLY